MKTKRWAVEFWTSRACLPKTKRWAVADKEFIQLELKEASDNQDGVLEAMDDWVLKWKILFLFLLKNISKYLLLKIGRK